MEHEIHQCANDWITCKCGKLFSDKKREEGALDDFIKHLRESGCDNGYILYIASTVTKESSL